MSAIFNFVGPPLSRDVSCGGKQLQLCFPPPTVFLSWQTLLITQKRTRIVGHGRSLRNQSFTSEQHRDKNHSFASAIYPSAALCLWLSLLIIPLLNPLLCLCLPTLSQCLSMSLLKTVPIMCLRSVNVTLYMLTREWRWASAENRSTTSLYESIHQALSGKAKQYRGDNETAAASPISTDYCIDFLACFIHAVTIT